MMVKKGFARKIILVKMEIMVMKLTRLMVLKVMTVMLLVMLLMKVVKLSWQRSYCRRLGKILRCLEIKMKKLQMWINILMMMKKVKMEIYLEMKIKRTDSQKWLEFGIKLKNVFRKKFLLRSILNQKMKINTSKRKRLLNPKPHLQNKDKTKFNA